MTATHLALCWKVIRRDGIILAFTNHDQDVERVDGVYRALPGFTPSAISTTAGLEADNFELVGALTHASITEADLWSGKYDGARIVVTMVDWTNPVDMQEVTVVTLGDVESDGQSFKVDTVGATALLGRTIVESISPECRAVLGDKRCKVALRVHEVRTAVQSVSGDSLVVTTLVPDAAYYAYGQVTWLTGKNAGVRSKILTSIGQSLTLHEPPPFAMLAGAHVLVTPGCDKRFITCLGKFNNKANFRGEPNVPGIDSLVRYPGLQ
jgi:uncharacterized phage protein (TIGR02218 family)